MQRNQFALFGSPLGDCALIWSRVGVVGLALPERNVCILRERIVRQFSAPDETPPNSSVQRVIAQVQQPLRGEATDLSSTILDMQGVPPFHALVYAAAREIPLGETVTYGALARRIGAAQASRAVGQALGRNPFAIIVPCHRVVSAGGKLGGFTAHGGVTTKQRLLEIERSSRGIRGSTQLPLTWSDAASSTGAR